MTLVANKRIVLILVSLSHFGNFGHEAKALDDFSSLGVKVVCQGERSRLQCDNASKKLTIYSATFGRTEPGNVICPYKKNDTDDNYNCGEVDLTNLFKIFCENKTRCKTKADDINKLGLFKNPCPEQYGYLKLVFSCAKKYSTPSTESMITNMPTSSTTAPPNVSSALILPTTSVMAIASTSAMLATQPTVTNQKSPKVHSTDTELTTSGGGNLPGNIPQQLENTGSSAVETGNGSLGVAGALFVWFLFWQDHSSDYAMIFFTSAACALALAVIVGVCVLYCHRESKQHLHTVDDSKLKAYEINDCKASEQVDRFILGPVKTAPPDYMLHECDWKSEESKGSQNNLPHGSVVKNFSDPELLANGMNGPSRPALETPSRPSSNGPLVGAERPDGSTIFFKSPFPSSEESLESKKGRYVNVEDYRKARNKDGAAKMSGESYFYYRN